MVEVCLRRAGNTLRVTRVFFAYGLALLDKIWARSRWTIRVDTGVACRHSHLARPNGRSHTRYRMLIRQWQLVSITSGGRSGPPLPSPSSEMKCVLVTLTKCKSQSSARLIERRRTYVAVDIARQVMLDRLGPGGGGGGKWRLFTALHQSAVDGGWSRVHRLHICNHATEQSSEQPPLISRGTGGSGYMIANVQP